MNKVKGNLFVGIMAGFVALFQTVVLWDFYPLSSVVIWLLVAIIWVYQYKETL